MQWGSPLQPRRHQVVAYDVQLQRHSGATKANPAAVAATRNAGDSQSCYHIAQHLSAQSSGSDHWPSSCSPQALVPQDAGPGRPQQRDTSDSGPGRPQLQQHASESASAQRRSPYAVDVGASTREAALNARRPSLSDDLTRLPSTEAGTPTREEDVRPKRSENTQAVGAAGAHWGSERPSLSSSTFVSAAQDRQSVDHPSTSVSHAGPSGGVEPPFPHPSPMQAVGQSAPRQSVPAEVGKKVADSSPTWQATQVSPTEDVTYLKRNVEHLRSVKHRLEARVQDLEARVQYLEQRRQQYKTLYEQAKNEAQNRGSGELEISSLSNQLDAVCLLKDALNDENSDLRYQLEVAQHKADEGSKQATCVICMDNLANLVCLPCKHLALCSYCGAEHGMVHCPICRTEIKEKLQIYTP